MILLGDSGSLSSLGSSSSASLTSSSRHPIDQLFLNMGLSGIKASASNSSNLSTATTASSTSLINSSLTTPPIVITQSHSQQKLESIQDARIPTEESMGGLKERLITKIDPIEMTAKPTVITVPQDSTKRSAMLLSGPKFRLNTKEILTEKLTVNNDSIYSISVSLIHYDFTFDELLSLDNCWYYLSNDNNMETNFIVFFRFNCWLFICYSTCIYMDSNVYSN